MSTSWHLVLLNVISYGVPENGIERLTIVWVAQDKPLLRVGHPWKRVRRNIDDFRRRAGGLVFARRPRKSGRPSCSTLVYPQGVPSEMTARENVDYKTTAVLEGGEREPKPQSPKAEIGPMTTNRKSDRTGQLGLGNFFNATPIFELIV